MATVYTFHSEGYYNDPNNWDNYPGTELYNGDTIVIDAYCHSINLFTWDGYLIISDNVSYISISDLSMMDDAILEVQSSWLHLDIQGSFSYYSYEPIVSNTYVHFEITNGGYGIDQNGCMFDPFTMSVNYHNFGYQDGGILSCIDGYFVNQGELNVNFGGTLYVDCDLELADGTITGFEPYNILEFNGNIMQNCSNCTATINNISNLWLNKNTNILGKVILNGPD